MLPAPLIEDFWVDVLRLLKDGGTRLTDGELREWIGVYRGLLRRQGVQDILYHQSPGDVAQAIEAAIFSGGFPSIEAAPAKSPTRP